MSDHRPVAERLAEASRLIRSPLARDLSGAMTQVGEGGIAKLDAILGELHAIEATTTADALALASLASDLLGLLARNADGNDKAFRAVVSLALALAGLKACLSDLSGRHASEFTVSAPIAEAWLSN